MEKLNEFNFDDRILRCPLINSCRPCFWCTEVGDSNSQWHKENLQEVSVGGIASWGSASLGKCQLGEVPVLAPGRFFPIL